MLIKGRRLRNDKKLSLIFCVFLAVFLFCGSAVAGSTYYTDTDNENNVGAGIADGDMDISVSNTGLEYPIEFNINVTGALPATSAKLMIFASDIDDDFGETFEVYFNGNLLGTLKGEDSVDSATIFDVPINQVNFGNNLVRIEITGPVTVTIHTGQLLIDGGSKADAETTTFNFTDYSVFAGNVTLDVVADMDITTTGDYRLEINMINSSGVNVGIFSESFSATAGDRVLKSYSPVYALANNTGTHTVEASLFYLDTVVLVQQDFSTISFNHIKDIGPNLPAATLNSLISVGSSTLTADGVSTSSVTLQGVDLAGINTTYSGQTVLFSATVGSLSPTIDNGDGTYSATLTAPTTTSLALITATIDGWAVTDTAAISILPGPATVATSSIFTLSPSVTADGLSTIIVFVQVKDAQGNNLITGGDTVTLQTDGGSLGSITDVGDSSYWAVLTSSTTAGMVTITGTLNGVALVDTEDLTFLPGPASLATTRVSASSSSIEANGVATSAITVQGVDVNGNDLITGGSSVTLSTTQGTLGAVSDLGDGRYESVLTSSVATGTAVITGIFDGGNIIDDASVVFSAGTASAGTTTITASASSIEADGTSTATITVQAIDGNGNLLTTGGDVVVLSSNLGTLSAVNDLGNGRYVANLTSTAVAGIATVTGTLNGVSLIDTEVVTFAPGSAAPTRTTVTASGSSMTANGVSSVTITVQAIDSNGNFLSQGGDDVVLNASNGSLTSVTDLGNGVYTAVLTSSTVAGTVTVSSVLNGVNVTDTAQVDFVPGPVTSTNSSISASLELIVGDGVTTTNITVQAIDAFGNFLTGGGESVFINSTAGTLSPLVDQGDGTYTATLLSDNAVVNAVVTGTMNGANIMDEVVVGFAARPTVNELRTNDLTPVLTGTVTMVSGASFTVDLDGRTYTQGDGNLSVSGSVWSLAIPPVNTLSEGWYSLTATVIDGALQSASDLSVNELLVDVTVPVVALDSLPVPGSFNTPAYDVTGSCSAVGDAIVITVTDSDANTVSSGSISCSDDGSGSGVFSETLDLGALENGNVTIAVTATDLVGNQGVDSLSLAKDSCNPINTVSVCDLDADGVSDGYEIMAGTDPAVVDTDGDGIADVDEFGSDQANPVDTDADGVIDGLDMDSDNDGIADSVEGGALVTDTDNDGRPDFQDTDSDGDYLPDGIEASYSPLDVDGDGLPNYLDVDSDGDGIPDSVESGITVWSDSDADGISDAFDVDLTGGADLQNDGVDDAIALLDTDLDSQLNAYDNDSDNDGLSDTLESDINLSLDGDGDGIVDIYDVDATGGLDSNNDGVDDAVVATNTDNDAVPDYLDLDSDNDAVPDVIEAGGTDSDPRDGIIDDADVNQGSITTPTTSDGDALPDFRDLESLNAANNGATPFDLASYGDIAALDLDADGMIDDTADADGDGIVDRVDELRTTFGSLADYDGDGVLNGDDLDDDNDGIPDLAEGDQDVDSDLDGRPDSLDLDSDNDGIADLLEGIAGRVDTDANGLVDDFSDLNGDGVDDNLADEVTAASFSPVDTDGDGLFDFQDIDSDGDSIFDLIEAVEASVDLSGIDLDSDGRVDSIDANGMTLVRFNPIDSDGDGQADFRDIDSDGDGFLDEHESGDYNNNGVPDNLEQFDGELETAVRGSGALGVELLVLALVMLFGLRRRLQHQQRAGLFFLFAMSPFLFISKPVSASNEQCAYRLDENEKPTMSDSKTGYFQRCWYGAMGLGLTNVDPEAESKGWSTDDNIAFGAKITIGYHFLPHWFGELSYSDLGKAKLGNINPVLSNAVNVEVAYRAPALMLGYYFLPAHRPFNVYLKAGMSTLQTTMNDARVDFQEQNDSQVVLGGGAQYRFRESAWFTRFEFDSFDKDASMFGIHVGRYFGHPRNTVLPGKGSSRKMNKRPVDEGSLDSDQDGVTDRLDLCPNTIVGHSVNLDGCCVDGEKGCARLY